MKILAIETSCDDTGISIVKVKSFDILSNVVSSQIKVHRKWGGVWPSLAKREHQKNLVPVLIEALRKAKILKIQNNTKIQNSKFKTLEKILKREGYLFEQLKKFLTKYQKPRIDLIAVTVGPGLEPCLWVGVNFAKALSYFWQLPIVPVNHIEAHILINFYALRVTGYGLRKLFPAICLVVSGGHTQLILMEKIGQYKILGQTRDDAAGECFDKVARILGLSYPGGPAIAKKAAKFQVLNFEFQVKLPRPMIHSKDYDFSFSGLKTAVLYNFKSQPEKIQKSKKYIQKICKEVQQAIIDVLIEKTLKAAKEYKAKSIILGGGVVANDELRKQFQLTINKKHLKVNFFVPPKKFCTDNGAMVAITGYWHQKEKIKDWKKIEAKANLRIGEKN
jgi:N6-L-threonylcarbamoyladenine synthase